LQIIDFHIHLWKQEFLTNEFKKMMTRFAVMMNVQEFDDLDCTADKYLKAIEPEKEKHREYAIKHALIFPVDYAFTAVKFKISYEEYLNYIVSVCDEHDGFFSSLIGPDPRHGPKALELIDHYITQCGFKGILLTPSLGFSLEDPVIDKTIEKAGEYKVPIIIHDAGLVPRPLKLMRNLVILDEIFSKYPKQVFILCPFSQMDPTLMRVGLRHREHLMTDLSAFNARSIMGNMPDMFRSQPIIMMNDSFGSEKILFASDWPWYEQDIPIRAWVDEIRKLKTPLFLKPLGLPSINDENKERILSLNAKELLKLD